MEFPELGGHCHNPVCKQLDFLPMKCDSCSHIFCTDHIFYDNHGCPEAYRKNIQVPVCPLCNEPVPFKRGELPDIRVGEHIDRHCKSDPAKRHKIYTNRCNKKGCKTKELVKISCDQCGLTYCLKHRLEVDHECKERSQSNAKGGGSQTARAGAAAMQRFSSSQTSRPSPSHPRNPEPLPPTAASVNIQPQGMTEDQAMAFAMQMSLQENVASSPSSNVTNSQTGSASASLTEDEMLARAIAKSEEEERRRRQRSSSQNNQDSRSNCSVS